MFLAGGMSRLAENATNAGDTAKASQYGAAAASMIFIFTFVFGATWLTVPWLYPAEIFPLEVRAKGNAWGVVGWSIGNGWLVSASDQMTNRFPADWNIDFTLPRDVQRYRREDTLHICYQ
tara:strand:- start:1456 stop:1815 length:360 start_codon:yes stop_codon:yes gene_type:complete